jgi:signal transduction histidine kinase
MTLAPRLAITSLLVALPAAAIVTIAVERWRARDMTLAVERVARSQINEPVRERCESDPVWFLTGPLTGRPRPGDPPPGPEALPARPRPAEQGFELFPYDEELLGSSPASPRIPEDMKRALRRSRTPIPAPFVTPEGTGAQVALWTGWNGGPCAAFLARMRPPPGQWTSRLILFVSLVGIFAVTAFLATGETLWRARRLAGRVEASARDQHSSIVPDTKRDEIGTIAFAYNAAIRTIQLRIADIGDRADALERYAASTARVVAPLLDIEARLAKIASSLNADSLLAGSKDPALRGDKSHAQAGSENPALHDATRELSSAVRELHANVSRLETLAAAARLRGNGRPIEQAPVDLRDVVTTAVDRIGPAAAAAGLDVAANLPASPIVVTGDRSLFERALGALLDNAVRFTTPGSSVRITLEPRNAGRAFSLRVTDTGPGVPDEAMKGLAAIRRFRGDEDRVTDAGVPRIGLAVAREVAERAGFQMALRRPAGGGFEVEWTG